MKRTLMLRFKYKRILIQFETMILDQLVYLKTSTDLMQHNFEDLYLKNFKVCWKVEYTVFFIAHLAV